MFPDVWEISSKWSFDHTNTLLADILRKHTKLCWNFSILFGFIKHSPYKLLALHNYPKLKKLYFIIHNCVIIYRLFSYNWLLEKNKICNSDYYEKYETIKRIDWNLCALLNPEAYIRSTHKQAIYNRHINRFNCHFTMKTRSNIFKSWVA